MQLIKASPMMIGRKMDELFLFFTYQPNADALYFFFIHLSDPFSCVPCSIDGMGSMMTYNAVTVAVWECMM